ncbi:MAG: hypothetical protein GTO04_13245 [Planctomycetales bacterium]|nr:hypothetical protein [Planctomycetales bacterium]
MEYVAAVGAFCLLGWWIDRHWQIDKHWGLLICALVGLVGGMYNLIRQALAALKQADVSDPHEPDGPKE